MAYQDVRDFIEQNKKWLVPVGVVGGIFVTYSIIKGLKSPPPEEKPKPNGEPPTPPPPQLGKTVVLDAGHGGTDPGSIYWYWSIPRLTWPPFYPYTGWLYEKTFNLDFAKVVGYYLEQAGVTVKYTRTTDAPISTNERIRMACTAKPNLLVSIHCDSDANPGTLGIYCKSDSYRLAQTLVDRTAPVVGRGNRGVVKDCTNVLLNHTCGFPSAIIRVATINDPTFDTNWLWSRSSDWNVLHLPDGTYIKRIGRAIADAILEVI